MQVKAKAKYLRISPRKARLVVDLVRGLDIDQAFNKLAVTNKKTVDFVEKLLQSAVANAEHNYELKRENLFIKEMTVDDGPINYRWMPRAFGRATQLRKRTSIVCVTLDEKVPTLEKKKKEEKQIETIKTDKTKNDDVVEIVKENIKTENINSEVEHKETSKDLPKNKGRNAQKQEKLQGKDKGVFKKMFRRKAGM